ncbi:MAG: DUF4838 domain-containing protein [Clostridiales bacterium]|jgi:hypothetical protein|nr:DUF4838 domain-containing protein [Clostridiales bacterium]
MRIVIEGTDIGRFAVRPSDSDPAARAAAERFAKYIGLTVGATPKTAAGKTPPAKRAAAGGKSVFIGLQSDFPAVAAVREAALGTDGVLIHSGPDGLYLVGQNGRGCVYAVYEFLERFLGWRFLTETDETRVGEGDISLSGVFYAFTPPFDYRWPLFYGAYEPEFMLKQRSNVVWEGKLPDELGGSLVYAGGHCAHTYEKLLPPETYFAAHPEYFMLDADGARKKDQPCLTNPDVFEIMLAGVRRWIAETPGARFVNVSPNDNNSRCLCPECSRLNERHKSPGATAYRFANRVAAAIKEESPHILVEVMPYLYTETPPEDMPFEDNLSVRSTTMGFCREHVANDESCYFNARQRAYFSKFARLTKNLYMWDYMLNSHDFLSPLPHLKLLWQNMRWYRNFNLKGVMYQYMNWVEGRADGEFGLMWNYAAGKLLWNPDMEYADFLDHIKDFLQLYYGGGWLALYEYLTLTHTQTRSGIHNGPAGRCEFIVPMTARPDGTPDTGFIRAGNGLFDRAEAGAETPEKLERVKRARLQIAWYEIYTTYDRVMAQGSEEEKKAFLQKYADFHAALLKYNVLQISEGKQIPRAFDPERRPGDYVRDASDIDDGADGTNQYYREALVKRQEAAGTPLRDILICRATV